MKTLSHLFALTSVSLFIALIPAAHAAPLSPAGDWDFVMSGKQRGIALITFDSGSTLFGTQILRSAPNKNSSSSSGDPRNPTGIIPSRTGPSTSTNATPNPGTNFFGSTDLEGYWTYNQAGRIIGTYNEYFYTVEDVTHTYTNIVDGSNVISTITAPENVKHTNGISFRGTVGTGGNKLVLNVYTPRGLTTYTGVRMVALPDYTGNYYGVASKDRPFVEFFSIVPNGLATSGYSVNNGVGPGYNFTGHMIVSRQKHVAIQIKTEYDDLSVYIGPYKTNRSTGAMSGDLRGTDGVRNNFPYKLSPRP
jgi:hypothetical protein